MLKEIIFVSSVILVGRVLACDDGVNTSERPKDAPIVSEVVHDKDWYVQALHGVSKPYPYSFNFIKDQGNWYTPFNKAGMLPPYDIRDWHK